MTRTDRPRQAAHRAPQFLPDGRHFLYYVAGNLDARGVYVGDLDGADGSQPRRLLDADTAATYVSSGHLLFVRRGTLFAQRFDANRMVTIALDDRLMGVPIRPRPQGQSPDIGTPVPLFTTRVGGAVQGPNMQQYMVASDGRRFLMNAVVEDPTSPIVILLNWQSSR